VLNLPVEDLESTASVVDRWRQQIEDITGGSGLQERLFTASQKFFSKSDWEYLLTDVLQHLNPSWKVERTGGKADAKHGTDILVTIPDVFRDGHYGIAIQVKDYEGVVSDDPIHQILKAKNGYWKEAGIEILESVVVLIRGDRQAGHQLEQTAMAAGVRLIWSTDIEELLFQ